MSKKREGEICPQCGAPEKLCTHKCENCGFYMKNCLKMNLPTPEELIGKAHPCEYKKQEIKKILERVSAKDEELIHIPWR